MPRAVWNSRTIAESENAVRLEGNIYFPPDSVNAEYLETSEMHSRCFWKGKASYHDLVVNGRRQDNAAWFHPKPWALARRIKDYVAFWGDVEVHA